jgi:sigma-B regulation protein RsbU (phosphoserine phosphatase)
METSHQDPIARELDQRLVELHSLFEMGQVLNASLNLRTILSNLLLTPMGRMMVSRGLVMLISERGDYEIIELRGLSRSLIGKKWQWEATWTKPLLLSDPEASQYDFSPILKELDLELLIPLVSTQRVVGLMGLGSKLDRSPFSAAEIEYLYSLSNIAAKSIENALIVQRMEQVNRQLDKKIQELNTLFEIGKELNATLDPDKIVNLMIYAIMGEMVVNRCFVFLMKDGQLQLAVARGLQTESELTEPFQRTGFLKSLARVKHALRIADQPLSRNLAFLKPQKIQVILPMHIQDKRKGYVLLGEKITKQPFREDELEFLTTLVNQAMISLENARLFKEALEKQRIEEELNIARDIQQRLLPSSFPKTPALDIEGLNIPSQQVGGDYLDWIPLDIHRIAVTIADVSGKGIPASLLMSSLQAGLRNSVTAHSNMGEMVGRLNNFIHANTTFDKFITFFYAEINVTEKNLTYVNAGHNPPYLFRADGSSKRLETGGLILGMMADMPYQTETVPLQSGDLLILFTDGVTEAKNSRDQDFEEYRLEEIISKSAELPVKLLLDEIVYALRSFTKGAAQSDDITLMAVRIF